MKIAHMFYAALLFVMPLWGGCGEDNHRPDADEANAFYETVLERINEDRIDASIARDMDYAASRALDDAHHDIVIVWHTDMQEHGAIYGGIEERGDRAVRLAESRLSDEEQQDREYRQEREQFHLALSKQYDKGDARIAEALDEAEYHRSKLRDDIAHIEAKRQVIIDAIDEAVKHHRAMDSIDSAE